MPFSFKFPSLRKTFSIGIDLGADTAKLVCLLSNKAEHRLVAHALVKKDQLYGLQDFINHPDLKDSEIRIAIHDPNIKIHRLSLPVVPKDELQEMVGWALRDATEIPIEDYVVRYHTSSIDSKTKQQDVTAFAMEKEHLEKWKRFIEESGIKEPKLAEPNIQSLTNLVLYNYDLKANDRYAIIDIGKTQSQMAIVSCEGIEFYRPFSGLGTDQLASNLTLELGLPEQDKTINLLELMNQPADKKELVNDIVSRFCAQLCIQAQYAIENYNSSYKDKPVTNVILSGGGALLEGIKEQVQETLHFPTDLLDPFERFDLGKFNRADLEAEKTLYSVAAGLAL